VVQQQHSAETTSETRTNGALRLRTRRLSHLLPDDDEEQELPVPVL